MTVYNADYLATVFGAEQELAHWLRLTATFLDHPSAASLIDAIRDHRQLDVVERQPPTEETRFGIGGPLRRWNYCWPAAIVTDADYYAGGSLILFLRGYGVYGWTAIAADRLCTVYIEALFGPWLHEWPIFAAGAAHPLETLAYQALAGGGQDDF